MKTIGTILAVVALLVVGAGSAQALNLMNELFSYPNGNLSGNGGWVTHSGTGTDIQVASGAAVGVNTNTPDDNKTFAAQDTNATTYACFQVIIPTPATTPIVGGYFAHFKDTGTLNFVSRVYALPVTGDPTHFTFGVSVYSTNALTQVGVWPSALNFGQSYWVVIAYNAPAKSATLWVNPGSPSSPSVTSTTSSATSIPKVSVSGFALRQSSSGSPISGSVSWGYNVDNLGVGTTFYDACAFTGITPTKSSTWGQIRKVYR